MMKAPTCHPGRGFHHCFSFYRSRTMRITLCASLSSPARRSWALGDTSLPVAVMHAWEMPSIAAARLTATGSTTSGLHLATCSTGRLSSSSSETSSPAPLSGALTGGAVSTGGASSSEAESSSVCSTEYSGSRLAMSSGRLALNVSYASISVSIEAT